MDPAAYVGALQNWLTLGLTVFQGGQSLWNDIKAVLAKHGVDSDNAALDAIILNAATRKAQADRDAAAPTPEPPQA